MGTSRTKWLNDCISQRLDRDYPETIGIDAAPPPEPVKTIDPMEIWEEHKKAARAARPLEEIGAYRVQRGENSIWRTLAGVQVKKAKKLGQVIGLEEALERAAEANNEVLSEEEKVSIMEEYNQKQMEEARKTKLEDYSEIPDDVKGHPIKYAAWNAKRQAFLASQTVEAPQDDGEHMMQMESLGVDAPDSDFWGDDEADKVRALVKRHTR